VKDNATQGYVLIGGNGGNSVYLNGTAGNATIVGTSAATNTNGNLQLQASTGATNTVNITDTTVTVDQILAQQQPGVVTYGPGIGLAVATRGNGNYDFSIGTYATGLWMLMVRVANGNLTDSATCNNMFSTLLYIQQQTTPGTSIVVGGGAGGSTNLYSTPIVTGALGADSIRIVNNSGSNMYFSVKMLPIMGTLPGFNA
jgi:ABC-type Fe3+-hydroxamate transport system substrate-binding protein